MTNLFLGKPLHWFVLAAVAAGMWFVGELRLHVIHFNSFVLAVLGISVVCVLIVLFGNGRGERLTRDEIEPDETEKDLENL